MPNIFKALKIIIGIFALIVLALTAISYPIESLILGIFLFIVFLAWFATKKESRHKHTTGVYP